MREPCSEAMAVVDMVAKLEGKRFVKWISVFHRRLSSAVAPDDAPQLSKKWTVALYSDDVTEIVAATKLDNSRKEIRGMVVAMLVL